MSTQTPPPDPLVGVPPLAGSATPEDFVSLMADLLYIAEEDRWPYERTKDALAILCAEADAYGLEFREVWSEGRAALSRLYPHERELEGQRREAATR